MNEHVQTFSVYDRGFMRGKNTAYPQNRPCGEWTLQDVHKLVTSDRLKTQTEDLRERIKHGKKDTGTYKLLNFPTVTFSGVFSYRNSAGLVRPNNLLVLDFDHIAEDELPKLWASLLGDSWLSPELQFHSPSGTGIKTVIEVNDWQGLTRAEFFTALSNYIEAKHGCRPDPSGKDVTRLCFLCHDPKCYINPKYTEHYE